MKEYNLNSSDLRNELKTNFRDTPIIRDNNFSIRYLDQNELCTGIHTPIIRSCGEKIRLPPCVPRAHITDKMYIHRQNKFIICRTSEIEEVLDAFGYTNQEIERRKPKSISPEDLVSIHFERIIDC